MAILNLLTDNLFQRKSRRRGNGLGRPLLLLFGFTFSVVGSSYLAFNVGLEREKHYQRTVADTVALAANARTPNSQYKAEKLIPKLAAAGSPDPRVATTVDSPVGLNGERGADPESKLAGAQTPDRVKISTKDQTEPTTTEHSKIVTTAPNPFSDDPIPLVKREQRSPDPQPQILPNETTDEIFRTDSVAAVTTSTKKAVDAPSEHEKDPVEVKTDKLDTQSSEQTKSATAETVASVQIREPSPRGPSAQHRTTKPTLSGGSRTSHRRSGRTFSHGATDNRAAKVAALPSPPIERSDPEQTLVATSKTAVSTALYATSGSIAPAGQVEDLAGSNADFSSSELMDDSLSHHQNDLVATRRRVEIPAGVKPHGSSRESIGAIARAAILRARPISSDATDSTDGAVEKSLDRDAPSNSRPPADITDGPRPFRPLAPVRRIR